VRDALTHAVDLTSPARKSQLRVFAEFCSDADPGKQKLLALCAKSGKDAYARDVVRERASTLDILNMAPTCFGVSDYSAAHHFGAFLEATPPLQPRMYSITTAPETAPTTPAVAFSVVRFASPAGVKREGVATNFLDRLDFSSEETSATRVPVFIKRSVFFKPPDSISTPTLMIGPGTGVAPFRGFLQRRAAMVATATEAEKKEKGPCWLFFGCRRAEEDFLYRSDLECFEASGVLDALTLRVLARKPEREDVRAAPDPGEDKRGWRDCRRARRARLRVRRRGGYGQGRPRGASRRAREPPRGGRYAGRGGCAGGHDEGGEVRARHLVVRGRGR
jgi:NADPH-ferrihemoprotein reductase